MPAAHRKKLRAAQDAPPDRGGMPRGRRLPVPAVPALRPPKSIPIFDAPENEPRRRMAPAARLTGQAGRRTRRFQRPVPFFARLQKRVRSRARYFPPVALKKISVRPSEAFRPFYFSPPA